MSSLQRGGFLLALLIVGALVVLGTWRGVVQVHESLGELEELEARCSRLRESNERLSREVKSLQHDREARTRAARETLDVAGPGEVVVLVSHSRTAAGTQPVASVQER